MTYLPILFLAWAASAPKPVVPATVNSDSQMVYREILDTLGNPFVQEESELPSWTVSESEGYRRVLKASPELFALLLRENVASRKLAAGRELHPGALTIPRATYLEDPCKGWDAYTGDYPSINGFVVVSLVAIDPQSSTALVFVARRPHCPSELLKGILYLLERGDREEWQVVKEVKVSTRRRTAG